MLEGGEQVPPSQFLSHKWPYELPYRGLRSEKQDIYYQGDVRKSIRYVDSDNVAVDRIRVLGGRTVTGMRSRCAMQALTFASARFSASRTTGRSAMKSLLLITSVSSR